MKIAPQALSPQEFQLASPVASEATGAPSAAPKARGDFEAALQSEAPESKENSLEISTEAAALAAAMASPMASATPSRIPTAAKSLVPSQASVPNPSEISKPSVEATANSVPKPVLNPASSKSDAPGAQAAQTPTLTGGVTVASLGSSSTISQAPWSRQWVFEDGPSKSGDTSAAGVSPVPSGDSARATLKASPNLQAPMLSPSQVPGFKSKGVERADLPERVSPAPAGLPGGLGDAAGTSGVTLESLASWGVESSREAGESKGRDVRQDRNAEAKSVQNFSGSEYILTKQALNPVSGDLRGDTRGEGRTLTSSPEAGTFQAKAKELKNSDHFNLAGPQILGNPTAASVLNAKAAQPAPQSVRLEQSGQVVKGSMAKDRLSTEALRNLTGSIRTTTLNPLGGEIRLRLAPDHLGEVRLKISSIGSQVKLNIQASSERAKQIMEDSIGFLREAMTTNQLSLSKVDIGVASPSSSSGQSPQWSQSQDSGQAWNQAMNLQQGDGGNRGQAYREMVEDREWGGTSGVSGVSGARAGLKNAGLGAIPSGLSSMGGGMRSAGLNSQQRIDIRV